jgi:signal transduction histidine kinase
MQNHMMNFIDMGRVINNATNTKIAILNKHSVADLKKQSIEIGIKKSDATLMDTSYKQTGLQEQELKAAKEHAEKAANQAIIFSGSIAHELRTSLSVIQLYADLLGKNYECKRTSKNKKTIASCVKVVKQTIKDANYVIANLLLQVQGIAKNEVGKRDFALCSITKNIREMLAQYPFEPSKLELVTIEDSEDFEYVGNSVLTNHVLFNLIKNALWAIKNTGKGKITIQFKRGKKFNKLVVTDTASGIPQNFLPKIFDPFESQMTSQGGTDLGLAFCKTIMQSYEGDIVCNSEEGKYTEFTLWFPRLSAQYKNNKHKAANEK